MEAIDVVAELVFISGFGRFMKATTLLLENTPAYPIQP